MSIRITCPSCSAQLALKDEFAGRAAKCPKCGSIIPPKPTVPSAPPPKPSALPKDSSLDDLDAPRKKPARARDDDENQEDNASEKRKSSNRRRDNDEEDERSSNRRRRESEDDDHRERKKDRKRKKKGSSALVLGVIGGIILICCGGFGVGGYLVYVRVKEGVEKIQEVVKESSNPSVTSDNYQKLKPTMTRAEVEVIMGPGKLANAGTVIVALENKIGQNRRTLTTLSSLAEQDRVLMWQNMGDFIFAPFTDKPDSAGKLLYKVYVHSGGTVESPGWVLDEFGHTMADPNAPQPGKPRDEDRGGGVLPTVTVSKLIGDYKADANAADKQYGTKRLLVTDGIVDSWENEFTALIKASGKNSSPKMIRVEFLDNQTAGHKPGATIKFLSKVVSAGDRIEMDHGWLLP